VKEGWRVGEVDNLKNNSEDLTFILCAKLRILYDGEKSSNTDYESCVKSAIILVSQSIMV